MSNKSQPHQIHLAEQKHSLQVLSRIIVFSHLRTRSSLTPKISKSSWGAVMGKQIKIPHIKYMPWPSSPKKENHNKKEYELKKQAMPANRPQNINASLHHKRNFCYRFFSLFFFLFLKFKFKFLFLFFFSFFVLELFLFFNFSLPNYLALWEENFRRANRVNNISALNPTTHI